ncbi:substance-K receptor [Carlito syrichta]|uniref:Substance-K receptor n=1 Tax=Carlito syrichta TaxID=1868482 RepID=A0A3Q0DJ73_CARSF|nr:substance-K receptor [Carlito syrichta]
MGACDNVIDTNISSGLEINATGITAFSMPSWQLTLWATAYLVLVLVAVTGNATVMWIILAHQRMRTVTNYFIVNLALADLCMATFNAAFNFVYASHNIWYFGRAFCYFQNLFPITAMFVSIYSMTAIAADRYMAIVHPFQPRFSGPGTKAVIAGIWLVALALAFPQCFYSNVIMDEGATKCVVAWPKDSGGKTLLMAHAAPTCVCVCLCRCVGMFADVCARRHALGNACVGVCLGEGFLYAQAINGQDLKAEGDRDGGLPGGTGVCLQGPGSKKEGKVSDLAPGQRLGSLIGASLPMGCGSHRFQRNGGLGTLSGQRDSPKFVKTMVLVVVTFAICWLPYHLYFILGSFQKDIYCHKFIQQVYLALFWLAMSSTMYNPIIYCCLNHRFRSGFRLAFRCCPWVTPTEEDKLELTHTPSLSMRVKRCHTKETLLMSADAAPSEATEAGGLQGGTLPWSGYGLSGPAKTHVEI